MSRALLEQAHAALDTCESMTGYYHDERAVSAAMVAITAALAQPEPEPVEWLYGEKFYGHYGYGCNEAKANGTPLYDVEPAPTGDKS